MKILYSPGYGAGWVSWHSGNKDEKMFMLTYQPFIEAIEAGKDIDEKLIDQFNEDFKTKFPTSNTPYTGGVYRMDVENVPEGTTFRISEYDGDEGVKLGDNDIDWFTAE